MMEKSNSTRIWSLPGGDRRGTSGADAGRYSMQAIGGEGNGRPSAGEPEKSELNRRYNLRPLTRSRSTSSGTADRSRMSRNHTEASRLVSIEERGPSQTDWAEKDQDAQSLTSSPKSLFSSIPSSPPSYLDLIPEYSCPSSSPSLSLAEDVVQATIVADPAPAKAKLRARKKWTEEMNTFILRTYFILTKLESDTKSYLAELHSQFNNRFPEMDVSKQRLGDQRRAIVQRQLLTTACIAELKAEASTLLSTRQLQTQQSSTQVPVTQRMHWTTEHNEAIIKAYYRITQLETNKTAYRKALHQSFINIFPHLAHVSEQRIADQRRVIITNKYIDNDRLDTIRQEVADELGTTDHNEQIECTVETVSSNDIIASCPEDPRPQLSSHLQNNVDNNVTQDTLDRVPEIDESFAQALDYFKNTNPEERPYIPKQRSSKKLAKVVNYLNEKTLPAWVNIDTDFKTLQTSIYCAAWTAAKINGTKLKLPPEDAQNRIQHQYKPKWQIRLERKVEDLRKKIARLTQYINGNTSRPLTQQIHKIMEQYKVHSTHEEPNTNLSHFLDTLKQKLTVISSRLRRYKACTYRKSQNSQFTTNEKKFYQNLSKLTSNNTTSAPVSGIITVDNSNNTPNPVELRQFWADIWENPVEYKEDADWVRNEEMLCLDLDAMEYESIPIVVFQSVLRTMHNWKAPGSDHIHSYWYKKLTHIHPYLYNHINSFIIDPSSMPLYITSGTTHMIPKDRNDMSNPAKYRPITCLQTLYKVITACLSKLIYKHIDAHKILTEQQKGCRKFSQGCKEQLIIDSVILKQVQRKKEDLYTVYIDYKKAFDSIPHAWLTKILEIYKVHPQLISFLSEAMSTWTTRLYAQTLESGVIKTPLINIQRGIFQGDALSPLWFCLALNPLSNTLNSSDVGYVIDRNRLTDGSVCRLNHLLYMDDIKIYASTQADLESLMLITEQFSQDISMQFGIDKCKINSIKAGQIYQHSYHMQSGETIDPLDENETYKYLGYQQSMQIHYKEVKTKLTTNYKHRLNAILKTQLNSKNTTKAINSYVIPILTYSFGIINWTKLELKNLQRVINVTMTKNRKHHPRSGVQRQILPRLEGGRGIIDIHSLHNRQITSLRTYFYIKAETSTIHKSIVKLDRKLTPLNLQDHEKQKNEEQTDRQALIADWTQKSLHGRHRHDLSQPNVDKDASNEWLSRGELFPETEGFMIAIQDQVIETRNYQKHIMKVRNLPTDLCRRCNSSSETIQHITGACRAIVQTDYKFRHDQVANIIHQRLAAKYDLIDASVRPIPYYKYTPEVVLENAYHKLYFDRAILTDKTTHYNRPDLTLIDKTNKTALIIDIAIPNTHNMQSTIAEKLSKYIDLKDEITRMWRLQKVSIVPIVLSSTGVIPNQLFQSLSLLDLPKHTFALLQKAVILNTCRIVRKFLQTALSTELSSTLPCTTVQNETTRTTEGYLA